MATLNINNINPLYKNIQWKTVEGVCYWEGVGWCGVVWCGDGDGDGMQLLEKSSDIITTFL